ncbi:unnamed protein product [Ectocarpus sp. 4 AP-2014]
MRKQRTHPARHTIPHCTCLAGAWNCLGSLGTITGKDGGQVFIRISHRRNGTRERGHGWDPGCQRS